MTDDLSNRDVAGILRRQAWERAKGELRASLATYQGEREEYESASALVAQLIADVESRGYLGT